MDVEVEGMLHRLTSAIERGGLGQLSYQVDAELRRVQEATAHVAVLGPAGVGKTTFISTVLHLKERPSAPPRQPDLPRRPVSYSAAGQPSSVFWELPVPEDSSFSPGTYLRAVEVDKYAGFLLLTCSRFTEDELALASELRRRAKPLCLLRTKIDLRPRCYKDRGFAQDVLRVASRHRFPDLDAEQAADNLYQLDCMDPERYDFGQCVQAVQKNAPPGLQQHALLLSLRRLSPKHQLRDSLKALLALPAIRSCLADPQPVDGLPFPVNVPYLHAEVCRYRELMGLDFQSVRERARVFPMPAFVLWDELRTKLLMELSEDKVAAELVKWSRAGVPPADANSRWDALFCRLPGGRVSAASVIRFLGIVLEQFVNDAYRVESKLAAALRGDVAVV